MHCVLGQPKWKIIKRTDSTDVLVIETGQMGGGIKNVGRIMTEASCRKDGGKNR